MLLTEKPSNSIEYKGKYIDIDMSFDNILLFYDMSNDEELNNNDKLFIGIEMLVENVEDIEGFESEDVFALFTKILQEKLGVNIYSDNEANNSNNIEGHKNDEKIMDFNEDAYLIYSSFMFDYNIDLFEQQGKMHWDKFKALLDGLSKNSALMKVIEIRTMEIPKPNKHNQKERKNIIDLKNKYALKSKGRDVKSKLDSAASFLKGRSKSGGDN